jgi:hypothetical protein
MLAAIFRENVPAAPDRPSHEGVGTGRDVLAVPKERVALAGG